MLPENIIYLSVLISLIGPFFYVRSMLEGHTQPNLVSWSMWMLAPFIGVFFQIKAGAGLSIIPIFMAGLGPCIVIAVAIFTKKSFWKINAFDVYCGALSVIALIFYILTHNLGISVLFVILSDALAFVPTYVKAWYFPQTESSVIYICAVLSNIIGLLIIKNWIFTVYSFGSYLVMSELVIIFILYRKNFSNLFKLTSIAE